MKEQVEKLENYLVGVFKNAPAIPENGRKSLVTAMPWIALVFGIFSALGALSLWNAGHRVNELVNTANTIARSYGYDTGVSTSLSIFYWVSLLFIIVQAVLLLLAFPGLKAINKTGWNWLFYGSLVGVPYGIFSLFVDASVGGGVSNFVMSVVSTLIGFWLLFQVRDNYLPKKVSKEADKK